MKTNKKCSMYKNNPVNVAPTDQELAEQESNLSQDDLVKVEGTKVPTCMYTYLHVGLISEQGF